MKDPTPKKRESSINKSKFTIMLFISMQITQKVELSYSHSAATKYTIRLNPKGIKIQSQFIKKVQMALKPGRFKAEKCNEQFIISMTVFTL